MKTKIVQLKGVVFEGEAKLVNAQTTSGEVTILDGHQPLVSTLLPNTRVYLDDANGKRIEFQVAGGFLHLDSTNELTILAD